MRRLWKALTIIVCLMVMLACGVDADDRMVRRYAVCMADTNTTLHRLNGSGAVETVPLRRGGGGAVYVMTVPRQLYLPNYRPLVGPLKKSP